jgi:hypothetical protein
MADEQKIEEIEYEEETPDVEVNEDESRDNSQLSESDEEDTEDVKKIEDTPANIPDKLDKIQDEKIRGRIIIFDADKSEFAKNLKITKAGDYIEKK